jgi:hypothetical protein
MRPREILAAEDLSLHHAPLGALQSEAAMAGDDVVLNSDQVQHFEKYGYVSGVRVLDDEQVMI